MLRLYFIQQWYALSDPGLEAALYEIESLRRFAWLELAEDALPDPPLKTLDTFLVRWAKRKYGYLRGRRQRAWD